MMRILGFFNFFFGILELAGLYKHLSSIPPATEPRTAFYIISNLYELIVYPLTLLVLAIVSILMGIVNLGAFPTRSEKEEMYRILLSSFLIFAAIIIFRDLIFIK